MERRQEKQKNASRFRLVEKRKIYEELPSITFDYIDVTSELCDIQILEQDMNAIKLEDMLRNDTDVVLRKDLETFKIGRSPRRY